MNTMLLVAGLLAHPGVEVFPFCYEQWPWFN